MKLQVWYQDVCYIYEIKSIFSIANRKKGEKHLMKLQFYLFSSRESKTEKQLSSDTKPKWVKWTHQDYPEGLKVSDQSDLSSMAWSILLAQAVHYI